MTNKNRQHVLTARIGMLIMTVSAMLSTVPISAENERTFTVSADAKNRIEKLAPADASLNYFAGPSGTIGVGISTTTGQQMVVYASLDGMTLFSGAVIDTTTRENLTERDLQTKLPKPDFSGVLSSVQGAVTFNDEQLGAESNIYVFVDPFCGYCHKTYELVDSMIAAGEKINVHWIPVGVLGTKSQNVTSALLGLDAENGRAALHELMTKQVPAMDLVDAEQGLKALKINSAVYLKAGLSGVPAVVIQRRENVSVVRGLPSAKDLKGEM